jgi:anaerobic selenocysteine-containing dehydrogenase
MKTTDKRCATGVGRRQFLQTSALVGGSVLLSRYAEALTLMRKAEAGELAYPLAQPEGVLYSVCLQCHTACPIKGKIWQGVLVKIDGNPYSPQSMLPQIAYATAPTEAAQIDGKLCPKGQAGIQSLYDPYRLRQVLKRAGKRGENRWMVIPFAQAIQEIVEGGYLFKHVPGEEQRYVSGLKEIRALQDAALARRMAKDATQVAKKKMTLAAFQAKYRSHLSALIDPKHPDLGPKNNQFVFMGGRIEHGRKEFAKRWLKAAYGSINWFEHTTICEQSHHIATSMVSNQYRKGKWTKGKHHFKPDALHAEFILFFGTGAFEANFGPPPMAEKITEGLASGRLKIAVADPRLSKTAAKAWRWLPVKPGTDAALAMGLARWIIEQKRYDARFLRNANKGAAREDGEKTWSNATWLVKIDHNRPTRFLRAKDIGLGSAHQFVVSRDGKLVVVDPYDVKTVVEGDLMASGVAGGQTYKTAFQLLWEEVSAQTLEQWAAACGLPSALLEEVAWELTAHGKKSAVEFYRGPVQHTNGYYNAQAILTLNVLLGNLSWVGGLNAGGGHWHENGSKKGQPYPVTKGLHPGALKAFGVRITKEKTRYEDSTLFSGYPAPRPWYPFTSNVYQEILPAAEAGYPYPIKALFLHKGTPALSVPGAQAQIDILTNLEKVPLFFADDVVIGETSMYADYLFPDLSIWERWGTPHVTPDVQTKTSKVRQPMVAPIPETVTVFGEEMPISMEAVLLAIAERLALPGYGKDGFGPGQDFTRPEDYYLKMVANIAAGDKPGETVPDADAREMDLFQKARAHIPAAVYSPRRWRQAAGAQWWRKVVYVLNRGGRYEDFNKAYAGAYLGHAYSGLLNLFVEPVALARQSTTGDYFSGLPRFEPIKDAGGRVIKDEEFPFQLITFKEIFGGQSRTVPNYWSQLFLLPENAVLMNSKDAQRLGLEEGARVRLISRTNPGGTWQLRNGSERPVVGRVKPIEGLRPGVVVVSWHYGHWAYGASDVVIDGSAVKGDPRRATGLCPNVVMRIDETLKNVCLTDPIGGSSSFYDTRVRLVRA